MRGCFSRQSFSVGNKWLLRTTLFARSEQGVVSTEYAVFLLILAVSAVLGFVTLSRLTDLVYRQALLAFVWQELSPSNEPSRDPVLAEKMQSFAKKSSTWLVSAAAAVDPYITLLGGVIGMFFAVLLVGSFIRPRHSKRVVTSPEKNTTSDTLRDAYRRILFAKRNLLRRVLARSLDDHQTLDLPVRLFMSENVETVAPHTPKEQLIAKMRRKGIRHLVVTASDGRPVGVISSRDICAKNGATAREVMTPEPQTVDASTPISQAITLLLQQGISCLPVIADDKLVGIMTTTDVLIGFQALVQAWELVQKAQISLDDVEERDGTSLEPGSSPSVESLTPAPSIELRQTN